MLRLDPDKSGLIDKDAAISNLEVAALRSAQKVAALTGEELVSLIDRVRVTKKFDRTAISPGFSRLRQDIADEMPRPGGWRFGPGEIGLEPLHPRSQGHDVFFKKCNILEAVALRPELRRADRHDVVRVLGEQGYPVGKAIVVQQLGLKIEKLDNLSVQGRAGSAVRG